MARWLGLSLFIGGLGCRTHSLPATMCLDPTTGPFEYACDVTYGTDAAASICGQPCDITGKSCTSETLWMCAPGIATQEELHAMCLQACQLAVAGTGQECKVCGSSPDGNIIRVERMSEGLCCGGNPSDPPVPFLKRIDGKVITSLDGDIEMLIGDSSASTTTSGASASYELSNCVDSVCDITFTSIATDVADFQLSGHSFTNVMIESAHAFTGRLDLTSSLFIVPAGAMTFYSYFGYNGHLNSMDMNNAEAVVGFASTSANAFRFVGTVTGDIDGTNVTVNITLDGTYVNKGGPVPLITPSTQTVECTGPTGAAVHLDATASTDPDGDVIRFFWFEAHDQIADGPSADVNLALGVHDITVTALDPYTESRASTQVTVVDTTGPAISVDAPTCLWPPNHKMVRLALGSEILASSIDSCDARPGSVYISSVTTDDPAATNDDIAFGSSAVCLRAERADNSPREYTVTVSTVDSAGNIGSTDVVIEVPTSNVGNCSNDRSLMRADDDADCSF